MGVGGGKNASLFSEYSRQLECEMIIPTVFCLFVCFATISISNIIVLRL